MKKTFYLPEKVADMLLVLCDDGKISQSSVVASLIRQAFEDKDKSPGDELAKKLSERVEALMLKSLLPALRSVEKTTVTNSDILNTYFWELTENEVIDADRFNSTTSNPHPWVSSSREELAERIRQAQLKYAGG